MSSTPKRFFSDEARGRLREVSKLIGSSNLARKLEITRSAISQILSGKTQPSGMSLAKLNSVCGVSIDWLITGEGKAFTRDDYAQMLREPLPGFAQATPAAVAEPEAQYGASAPASEIMSTLDSLVEASDLAEDEVGILLVKPQIISGAQFWKEYVQGERQMEGHVPVAVRRKKRPAKDAD